MVGLGVLGLVVIVAVMVVQSLRHGMGASTHGATAERDLPGEVPAALLEATRRWVAAGIIDDHQAEQILDAETTRRTAESRLPLAAEAVGYLGGALLLVAGVVALGQTWGELASAARVAVAVGAASVLLGAGAVVRRRAEAPYGRLTAMLWLAGAGAAAFAGGVVAHETIDAGGPGVALGTGATGAVVAAITWRLQPTVIQHAATFAGVATTAMATVSMAGEPASPTPYGVVAWLLGATWAAAAWRGLLSPPPLGWALGGFAMLAGAQAMANAEGKHGAGLLVGVATVAALFVLGLVLRRPTALVVGVAGVFLFVPQTVLFYVGDALGVSAALALVGVVLLVLAAALAPLRTRVVALFGRHGHAIP